MPQTDTIKLLFTYTIAAIIIVGGGLMLYGTRLDPPATSGQLQLVISGFMGAAIAWVFSSESSTRATRAAQSSTAVGASAAGGHYS